MLGEHETNICTSQWSPVSNFPYISCDATLQNEVIASRQDGAFYCCGKQAVLNSDSTAQFVLSVQNASGTESLKKTVLKVSRPWLQYHIFFS